MVVCQELLERVDLICRRRQALFVALAVEAVVEQNAVPAPVEDRDAAAAGHRVPEAPQKRVEPLLLRFPLRRVDLEAARVERLDQAVDHRALARGAEALDGDDDRDALFLAHALQAAELCVQLAHQRVEFLLAHLL